MSQGLNKASDDGEIFEGFGWYFVVQNKTCKPYSKANFNVFARNFMLDAFKMAAVDQRHVTREHILLLEQSLRATRHDFLTC